MAAESLSSYARQFLEMSDKPDVDDITGLSPAISIEQKGTSHNPRSTVGTVTEIATTCAFCLAEREHRIAPNVVRKSTVTAWTKSLREFFAITTVSP